MTVNLNASSFMSGSPHGVMPLAGYAIGDGRTWYDPTFHGMPFPAAAQSAQLASVEGTQQQGGGGEQPDDDVVADAE
ncbi:hypothetical protein BFW01_g5954 [Lasiodiplodia theobromae]|nr:hypothetical protein BFW01_g5954 [Lasiodiplodia theobromae]